MVNKNWKEEYDNFINIVLVINKLTYTMAVILKLPYPVKSCVLCNPFPLLLPVLG